MYYYHLKHPNSVNITMTQQSHGTVFKWYSKLEMHKRMKHKHM